MTRSIRSLFAADRSPKARDRRRHLALDFLEDRKVMTAMPAHSLLGSVVAPPAVVSKTATVNPPSAALQSQSGTFDGVAWSYTYNASAKSWNLTMFDRPGSAPVTLSQSGYVISFQSNDVSAHPQAGPTVASAPGFTGSITLYYDGVESNVTVGSGTSAVTYNANSDGSDKPFVDNTSVTSLTVVPKTQTGTTMGLNWRFVQNDIAGDGTMYLQDQPRGSNAAIPSSDYLWINQDSGHVLLDVDYTAMHQGPAVTPNAHVNVVVANQAHDIGVKDDRGTSSAGLSFIPRSGTGSFEGLDDTSIPYSYNLDIAALTDSVTIGSSGDTASHTLVGVVQGLSVGESGFEPDYNPTTSIEMASDNQGGAVPVIAGIRVHIKTIGGSYTNNTPFGSTAG